MLIRAQENDIFTGGCACHPTSPVERAEDHDCSSTSALPKLPMDRVRVGGEALAAKELKFNDILRISQPESKGQHNLAHYHPWLAPPARGRTGAGCDCAVVEVPV